MNRRESVLALLAMGTAGEPVSVFAQEQRASAPFRIGLLPDFIAPWQPWLKIISKGLAGFGRIEGRDFVYYPSGVVYGESSESALDRFIETKPDLILVVNLGYAVALQRAGVQTPVVMLIGGFPVEAGVARSLARPGKNVTGLTMYAGPEVLAKLVQLLHETKPSIKRIGLFMSYIPPFHPAAETEHWMRGVQSGARPLGLDLRVFEIQNPGQVEAALAAAAAQGVDALLLTSGASLQPKKQEILQFAAARRLPTIVDTYASWSVLEPGPLLSYAVSNPELMEKAAPYVERILWQGTKPGDLPIQLPARFEFVVNQKTARAIGVTLPPSILMRADRVIE